MMSMLGSSQATTWIVCKLVNNSSDFKRCLYFPAGGGGGCEKCVSYILSNTVYGYMKTADSHMNFVTVTIKIG
jgi:hypothetical protein